MQIEIFTFRYIILIMNAMSVRNIFFFPVKRRLLPIGFFLLLLICFVTRFSAAIPAPEETKKEKDKQNQAQTSKNQESKPQPDPQAEQPNQKQEPKEDPTSQKKYRGEPGTFTFRNADLKNVLLFFAKTYKFNIVIDPGVSGKVTVQLVNVPWDQALDLILVQHGLTLIREGNTTSLQELKK